MHAAVGNHRLAVSPCVRICCAHFLRLACTHHVLEPVGRLLGTGSGACSMCAMHAQPCGGARRTLQPRAGQGQVEAQRAGQPRQEVARADVREQPNAALWHGKHGPAHTC